MKLILQKLEALLNILKRDNFSGKAVFRFELIINSGGLRDVKVFQINEKQIS